jgi:hypothetical protein
MNILLKFYSFLQKHHVRYWSSSLAHSDTHNSAALFQKTSWSGKRHNERWISGNLGKQEGFVFEIFISMAFFCG